MATRSAEPPALGLRPPEPGDDAIADQVPLELGDRRQDVEQQPAARGRRVNRLVEHDQVDAEGLEIPRQRHQVPRGARQTVKADAHHPVDVAGPHSGEQRVKRRPAILS